MLPKRAVLLVRISDDREGEEKGVRRQEDDGRRLAAKLGWDIAEVVVENDTSAFKRRKVRLPDGTHALRVVRPGFRRCLELLGSGLADGLLAYDLDRVCRDPRDLEDLIDVVEQRRIPVTSVSGSLRLASDADITMARVMVAVANKSSRDTSRRVARKHEELAEKGRPSGGGRRPFGYERDGMTIREAEAEAIRTAAAMLLDGASLYGLVEYLTGIGIAPSYAAAWSSRSIGTILAGPRIAGLRRFRGEVVGEAAWPAVLDRETWDAVQVKLKERALAGGARSERFVRWLTGLLRCGLCGHDLQGWSAGDAVRYWCATPKGGCGRIAIHADRAEAEVERQVLAYYGRPEVLVKLRGTYAADTVDSARVELAADEQQLKELAGLWARRELTFPEYTEARQIIAARVKESRALVSSALPPVVRALIESGDTAAAWEESTPYQRREITRAVLPGYTVVPGSGGFKVFDASRLVPIQE
jgi:site-specific DNA recombinase